MHKKWFFPLLNLFISLLIITTSALAQDGTKQLQTEITQIDIAAGKIAIEKQSVRNGLRHLTLVAKNMEEWFDKLNRISAEMQKVQQNKEKYATFNRDQIQDTLQQLAGERQHVLNLNGGITIDGRIFSSMNQLRSAYNNIPKETKQLHEHYIKLGNDLAKLDNQRTRASSQLETNQKADLTWHKLKALDLKDDLDTLKNLASDSNLWCVAGFEYAVGGAPPYITRKMAMQLITNKYSLELETTPGKKFNKHELAQRIIQFRNQSTKIKKIIREQLIPQKQQALAELQHKISLEAEVQNRSYDISGCWVIFLSQQDNPVINIFQQGDGYSAVITHSGVLADLRPGHRLFTVKPVSNAAFEGFEYSTDSNGNATTTPLQLILGKSGYRMDYRSDDILSLGRCSN